MRTIRTKPAGRRGYSLLEVMVALGILTVSLLILVETQSTCIRMTREAQRMVTGTNLAQEKLSEVLLLVEEEGFTDTDKCETGDFAEYGDETLDVELRKSLEAYHFEWCVREIDIALAGDLTGMAQGLQGSGYFGSSSESTPAQDAAADAGGLPDLGALGVSNELVTEQLARYIREVKVRVWWGESSKDAEEAGDEIVLTTHVINPTGAVTQMEQGLP
jgi:prepilin-type N-terminal cleavage/methylation domain-containing protein